VLASAVLNIAPEGNLSRYLQEIRKFPMLTPDEELDYPPMLLLRSPRSLVIAPR